MLKRNLIAIAILSLVMISSAFAQDGVRGKRPSKTDPEIKRSDAIVKPTTAVVNEIMIDGTKVWGNEVEIKDGRHGSSSETARTSGNSRKPKTAIKKPKQLQTANVEGTTSGNLSKTRKPTVKQMQENNTTYQQRRKPSNPRAKRQYKP